MQRVAQLALELMTNHRRRDQGADNAYGDDNADDPPCKLARPRTTHEGCGPFGQIAKMIQRDDHDGVPTAALTDSIYYQPPDIQVLDHGPVPWVLNESD